MSMYPVEVRHPSDPLADIKEIKEIYIFLLCAEIIQWSLIIKMSLLNILCTKHTNSYHKVSVTPVLNKEHNWYIYEIASQRNRVKMCSNFLN